MISNFRESDTKWIPEFPVCGCSCSPSLKKLSNWLPPACVGRAQRGLRTFLWTNVAANAGACALCKQLRLWYVVTVSECYVTADTEWVTWVMEIYEAWEPGSEPQCGARQLCFDLSAGNLESGELVTKCERGHYSALRAGAWCVVCSWSFPGDQINGGGGMGLDTMN